MLVRGLGYKYIDKFPTYEKLGGVYNFDDKPNTVNRVIKCWFNDNFEKINEIVCYENGESFPKFLNHHTSTYPCHIVYGDSLGMKEMFDGVDNHAFVSVDFLAKYDDLDKSLLYWWAKRANILFVSIRDDQLYDKWPKLKCKLVMHCAKGVYYYCGERGYVVENPYVDYSFKDLIGAGDKLASELLKGPITKTSIKRAMQNTYKYLKDKNECLKSTT